MKIHLSPVGNPQLCADMRIMFLRSEPRLHELCEDPEAADLIIVAGHWDRTNGQKPGAVTNHPLVRRYPEKCFGYSEDDRYLPLLPGVYTSAANTLSARLKRVRNYCYISRWRPDRNHFIVRQDAPKKLLFSFVGAGRTEVRTRLFKLAFQRQDILVEDTSNYVPYDSNSTSEQQHAAQRSRYAQIVAESHFILCPRGGGLGSIRFFEAMEMGICPVLISDNFLLPHGPDWDKFLISIPQKEIQEIERILSLRESESRERGELAYQAWCQWFAPQLAFNQIVSDCREIKQESRVSERYFRLLWPWMQFTHFVYYGSKKLQKVLRRRLRSYSI